MASTSLTSATGSKRFDRIVESAAAQNFAFGFVRGIAHLDAHQKAIELRFRQRIGAVMFDGILRGDDQKRLRQRMRFAVDGDLRFVHGFKQRGLRARRGAVDFVGEHDVGEKRAGTEFKFARFGLIDADAQHITRQQIGSELHALKAAVKRFGERLGQGGFANAGNVFDEQMAAGEKRDQRELNGFFLAVNGAGDGALQLRDDLRGSGRHWLKTPDNPVTKEMLRETFACV